MGGKQRLIENRNGGVLIICDEYVEVGITFRQLQFCNLRIYPVYMVTETKC